MQIKTEKEFNRYSIAISDFEQTVKFLEESENHKINTRTYQALLTCAIIYYYRPFSQNERNKDSQALSKISITNFENLTEEELTLHEHCKRIRNKALAHAEWSNYPTKLHKNTGVISSRPYNILSEPIGCSELCILSKKLMEQCHHLRADYVRNNRKTK